MKKVLASLIILVSISCISYSQNVKADFDIVLDYQCRYASVGVINKSLNADSCFWDFYGNGKFVYYSNPNPPFGNVGTTDFNGAFKFSMIAKGLGQSDTITKSVDFNPTIVKFDYLFNDSTNYAPLSMNFTNKSEPQNGDILTYTWLVNFKSVSTSKDFSFVFTNQDTYYVTLEALTQYGCLLNYSAEIIVKDSAQINEFDFITKGCIDERNPPCGRDKYSVIENDTLKIFGLYSGNCCTRKTATMKNSRDTIYIRTFQTGPECACTCGYCFSINVPNISADSAIVSFDGKIIKAKLQTSIINNMDDCSFEIYPNPIDNEFTLSCNRLTKNSRIEIQDLSGRVVYRLPKPLYDNMIIHCNGLKTGIYVLKVNIDDSNFMAKKISINNFHH